MTPLQYYIATRLDSIVAACVIITVLSGAGFVAHSLQLILDDLEVHTFKDYWKRLHKWIPLVFLCAWFLSILIPTTREASEIFTALNK